MAKKIREFMTHREPAEHIWMERDESAVIGTARMGQRMVPKIRCKREGGRNARKLSAFNYFTGMTGKGGARAPVLYNGREFRVDVYNLEEEQNGFHRGCDEDEIWF